MELSKFLFVVVLLTAVALAYVHQQVGLLKINYAIYHNRENLAVLLDQNSALMYNVDNLQSPFYLEQTLSRKKVDLEIPSRWHTIGFAEAETIK